MLITAEKMLESPGIYNMHLGPKEPPHTTLAIEVTSPGKANWMSIKNDGSLMKWDSWDISRNHCAPRMYSRRGYSNDHRLLLLTIGTSR